jgi:hypothetical protein
LCDDNTQLEVVFKLYGHQGQARYGVPLELARTYDGQVLMSGTSNNSSEIHGCIERHMTQEAMRIYPTSLVNTQGVTMTVSIKQQQHFVILHFCSSVTCAIPENRLSSCGNNGTFLVNLGVHSGSGGGFWLEEIEWTLREGGALYLSGYAPFDGILCLQNSTTYVLEMYDSYGDGWHDNIANFEGVDINFIQSCTLPYGVSFKILLYFCFFVTKDEHTHTHTGLRYLYVHRLRKYVRKFDQNRDLLERHGVNVMGYSQTSQ